MNNAKSHFRVNIFYSQLPEDSFLQQLISCLFIQVSEAEKALQIATTRLDKLLQDRKLDIKYKLQVAIASKSELQFFVQQKNQHSAYSGILN